MLHWTGCREMQKKDLKFLKKSFQNELFGVFEGDDELNIQNSHEKCHKKSHPKIKCYSNSQSQKARVGNNRSHDMIQSTGKRYINTSNRQN